MRVRTMAMGVIQAALLVACERPAGDADSPGRRAETLSRTANQAKSSAADAVALGAVGERELAAAAPAAEDSWSRGHAFDPTDRLIVRTGQASIEVDSLELAMAELRSIARKAGGFVADASVQSGRTQLRQATLQLKVPSIRFDELTEGLQPSGRLEYVNVGAEDVSEEFVDLTARAANGHRLEERLVELLRTRTGKLQDVLSVERELARVREEIERIDGRLRYLKTRASLSTLSVAMHEPPPVIASSGRNPVAEAFRQAWRNFVGVLAGSIALLGYAVPVAALAWTAIFLGKRVRRQAA